MSMLGGPDSLDFWVERFKTQAKWTKQTRTYIFNKIKARNGMKILDVGCGTGEIALELVVEFGLQVHGIDIDPAMIVTCKNRFKEKGLTGEFKIGNALKIPYPDDFFDITCCNFLLLWLKQPELAVREMTRVTRAKGYVLALAEPDYGG
ncbi:MAG: class I SAM-dependent methyltransferase, partial [Candidatus Helarchaeales archaeon]